MFSAIILPRRFEALTQFIDEKIIFYPATSNYFLCISTGGTIPKSIKDRLREVVIDTNFVSPVRAYQHFEYLVDEILPDTYQRSVQGPQLADEIDVNRNLLALRSKLTYAISELLSPSQFYVQLKTPVNSTGTRRLYYYSLYYNEIPCYVFDSTIVINEEIQPPDIVGDLKTIDQIIQQLPKLDRTLMEEIEAIIEMEIGPIICSTRSMTLMRSNPPQWYIRESLRDLCHFQDINMEDKILIQGAATGELYLFFKEDVNLVQDQQIQLTHEIRGNITSSIRAKIFPRNTPDHFIKSRQLVKLTNQQWSFPGPWSEDSDQLFKEENKSSFTFKNADQLFWFLLWLSLSPTYSFIEPELEIFVQESIIQVRYRTCYYPDYLRVMSARRVKHESVSSGKGDILYPGRLTQEVTTVMGERPFIYFYDNEKNERAVVALQEGDVYLPRLERTTPSDYSLDSRIKYDVDLAEVTSWVHKA